MSPPAARDRRRALQQLGALALACGAAGRVHALTIESVRIWPATDYTRVTIESDQPLAARHFMIDNPQRLVVDVDDLALDGPLRELVGKVRPDDPQIEALRVGQHQPRTVRLVLDLKRPVAPQVFTLPPVASYRHRLVFDLYPLQDVDPLLALVREREGAEQRAARALQQTLDELVARIDRGGSAPAPAAAPRLPVPQRPTLSAQGRPPTEDERQRAARLTIVALDPGHGGEDPGAIGPTGLREKDAVLAIALQLRDKLNALPGMRVLLTRDGDHFVPLRERVRKARRVQADLFVSIHADAFFKPEARGASVFALSDGAASSAAARWMAERENHADSVGGVNDKAQDAQVLRALADMSTAAQIKDSLKVGHEVLQRMGEVGRLHKRGVEQAGFAVLKAPDIPSILVETGFITNPEEEEQLRSPAYQRQLVDALAAGIQRYFARNPPLARSREL